MRDWNSALRIAYMTLLESTGYQVFYGMAPSDSTVQDKYIVISSINGLENSDKNSFDGNVSVLLDVVALGTSALNVSDNELMVTAIKNLIDSNNSPNLSPNFSCITTNLISDEQLSTITPTKTVFRRLLRYEHYIGQIT